jgi:hypothetical protein
MKNIIFYKKYKMPVKFINKNTFFFNKKFYVRLSKLIFLQSFFYKKKLLNFRKKFNSIQKVKFKKFQNVSTFKFSNYLREGDFFYNNKANEFVNKRKLFRRNV